MHNFFQMPTESFVTSLFTVQIDVMVSYLQFGIHSEVLLKQLFIVFFSPNKTRSSYCDIQLLKVFMEYSRHYRLCAKVSLRSHTS